MATEVLSPTYSSFKHAHTAATTAKTILLIGTEPVLPLNSADADAENVFVYEADRVRVPKATGEAWAPMEAVYWDDTAKKFTKTSTSNTLAGRVVEAAVSADTEGVIHLKPTGIIA